MRSDLIAGGRERSLIGRCNLTSSTLPFSPFVLALYGNARRYSHISNCLYLIRLHQHGAVLWACFQCRARRHEPQCFALLRDDEQELSRSTRSQVFQ